MENNYFYETPRLPMYMLMEDINIIRVRSLMYKNGKLEGVLGDWDAGILDTSFAGETHWNDRFEQPFYCLWKDWEGFLVRSCTRVRDWAQRESERMEDTTAEEVIGMFMKEVERYNVPIFESEEEARKYVFQR